jgi:hypothetical protein
MAVRRKGGKAVGKAGRQIPSRSDRLEHPGKTPGAPSDKTKPLPPYRLTAVPPKHPVHSPTPNRRGR